MDRKNSLRRSAITRRSNDGSEEKSVFSDSDSIHSVVDVSKRTNASSFMSLTSSIEEEEEEDDEKGKGEDVKEPTADGVDGNTLASTSFADSESNGSDDGEYVSDNSDEEFVKFGSGKRALEHNMSSAFFSTVYYDDDYLSDHKLSDKEQLKSASPAKDVAEKSDAISEDSLNSGSISSGDSSKPNEDDVDGRGAQMATERRSSPVENHVDNAEICTVESVDRYRPRDGIPKYVMLPNPFYRENVPTATVESSAYRRVKLELSSNSDEIVPPEILPRRDHHQHGADGGRGPLPVITVTETSEYSPTLKLKKIFVPSLAGRDESYYEKYNNVNSSTFNTLKKSPERENMRQQQQQQQQQRIYGDDTRKSSFEKEPEDAEMVVVKHYGDIVERYREVVKKTAPKTVYMDFEELKMAAVEDEPAVIIEPRPPTDVDECDEGEFYADEDDSWEPQEQDEDGPYRTHGPRSDDYDDGPASTADNQLAVLQEVVPVSIPVPYVKVFGNMSLALFGYWLYTYKDEKLSVPVFGYLLFRFFKTQIWDRI